MLPGMKGHACPNVLLSELLADIRARLLAHDPQADLQPVFNEPITEYGLDCPGMVMADRKWEDIPVEPGFTLGFPYSDFGFFLQVLEELSPRTFVPGGQQYFKLHGWMHCVVLTPDQRQTVLEYMRAHAAAVQVKADAEDQEFDARLADLNKDQLRVVRVKPVVNEDIPAGTPLSGKPSRERN